MSVLAYFLNDRVSVSVDGETLTVTDLDSGLVVRHQPSPVADASLDWVVARAAEHWLAVQCAQSDVDWPLDDFGATYAANPPAAWRKLSDTAGYPFAGKVMLLLERGAHDNPLTAAEVLTVLAGEDR